MPYIVGVKVYIANKSLITGYRCSFWFLFLVFGLHSSWIEIKKNGKCKKNSIHVRKIFYGNWPLNGRAGLVDGEVVSLVVVWSLWSTVADTLCREGRVG